jgi:hypothetical protein
MSHGDKTHAYANIIVAGKDDCVDGVLYKLSDQQIKKMDDLVCYPNIYQKAYFVIDGDVAFTYVSRLACNFSKAVPSVYYLMQMIKGAKYQQLYETADALQEYAKVVADCRHMQSNKVY